MTPLDVNVTIDSTTWAALALVLTILGAALRLDRLAPTWTGRGAARRWPGRSCPWLRG